MADTQFTYPFDPTGKASSNKITNERQTLIPPAWIDFYFLVPKKGPFFAEGFKATLESGNRTLVEGVDYILTHVFHDATLAVGKSIYGSITFYDKEMIGMISLDYQTLGGEWTIDEADALRIVSDTTVNPRTTTWEEVQDVPDRFPVIDHAWDLDDMVGAKELEEKLGEIEAAVREANGGSTTGHISNRDNPHLVTKAQIGLGNVQNYKISTLPQARDGSRNDLYMTPLSVKEAIKSQVETPVTDHLTSYDNPHRVSKSQVGLGNVQNYSVASISVAEDMESNNTYMTPYLTGMAIRASQEDVSTHLEDFTNPHRVTKEQVGLGEVANLPLATRSAAESGTSSAYFMTPLATRQAITAIALNALQIHEGARNNPHRVTAAQVGAATMSDINNAISDFASNDISASNTNKFAGKTEAEWLVRFPAPEDLESLVDTITTRYQQNQATLDGLTIASFPG